VSQVQGSQMTDAEGKTLGIYTVKMGKWSVDLLAYSREDAEARAAWLSGEPDADGVFRIPYAASKA